MYSGSPCRLPSPSRAASAMNLSRKGSDVSSSREVTPVRARGKRAAVIEIVYSVR